MKKSFQDFRELFQINYSSLTTTVPTVNAQLTTHNQEARTAADQRWFWWTNFTNSVGEVFFCRIQQSNRNLSLRWNLKNLCYLLLYGFYFWQYFRWYGTWWCRSFSSRRYVRGVSFFNFKTLLEILEISSIYPEYFPQCNFPIRCSYKSNDNRKI